ncbi:MAG: lipoprotein-releasing ABC transporter permease subunit [Candidatus Porifericomitaceae bacterium WSBS_2022_MAG_OTU9]
MLRPYPLGIGLRYAFSSRRNRFVSFISIISMLGLAVGVTALITVLSVMNGFERELRGRIVDLVAHATIYGDADLMHDWRRQAQLLMQNQQVEGAAPVTFGEGMLMAGRSLHGVSIRGVEPEAELQLSKLKMLQGGFSDLQDGSYRILLGEELATSLAAEIGTQLVLVTPEVRTGLAGFVPRLRRFVVAGIFSAGMYEFDARVVFIHQQDAMRLLRKQVPDGIGLRLTDMMLAPTLARELAQQLPGRTVVIDWTQRHSNFFRALKIEKTVMFVILTLIVAVAAFNVISMLMIVVTEKQAQIAVLRAMGASRLGIMAVFLTQGLCISLLGLLLGTAGGVWLSYNTEALVHKLESLFGTKFLSAEIYYIDELPSQLLWGDVGMVLLLGFSLSLAAIIYPAIWASSVRPAQVLRHE